MSEDALGACLSSVHYIHIAHESNVGPTLGHDESNVGRQGTCSTSSASPGHTCSTTVTTTHWDQRRAAYHLRHSTKSEAGQYDDEHSLLSFSLKIIGHMGRPKSIHRYQHLVKCPRRFQEAVARVHDQDSSKLYQHGRSPTRRILYTSHCLGQPVMASASKYCGAGKSVAAVHCWLDRNWTSLHDWQWGRCAVYTLKSILQLTKHQAKYAAAKDPLWRVQPRFYVVDAYEAGTRSRQCPGGHPEASGASMTP